MAPLLSKTDKLTFYNLLGSLKLSNTSVLYPHSVFPRPARLSLDVTINLVAMKYTVSTVSVGNLYSTTVL